MSLRVSDYYNTTLLEQDLFYRLYNCVLEFNCCQYFSTIELEKYCNNYNNIFRNEIRCVFPYYNVPFGNIYNWMYFLNWIVFTCFTNNLKLCASVHVEEVWSEASSWWWNISMRYFVNVWGKVLISFSIVGLLHAELLPCNLVLFSLVS